MMWAKKRFSDKDVDISGQKDLYRGFFRAVEYHLRHRLFGGGWSKPFCRELFVRGCAVGVLLYDVENDQVGLLEQFRIGALDAPDGPWLLEVVAGIMEPGEKPEDVARRELQEEAGISEAELLPLYDFLVSPGGSNERMIMYCALVNLKGLGGIYGLAEENEDIYLHIMDRQQAMAVIDSEQGNNAPLIIALQWLSLHYEAIQQGRLHSADSAKRV